MKNQFILAALLLSSSCAFAGPGYVGINAGSTKQTISFDGESASENTTGARVYGGFQVNPSFGIEAGYVNFGKVSESEDGLTVTFKPTAIYAAATGTMPMSPSFNLIGKLGLARTESTLTLAGQGQRFALEKKNSGVMFGFGAEYKFSETMTIVAEYEDFGKIAKYDDIGGNMKASMASVGLRIKF